MASNKLRIHVKFGDTKVLVPCGDGSITISEMVEKAIGKYRKAKKLNENDQVIPNRLYQESGSILDMDDEVCDVFDDKETVILEYQYIPHDAHPGYVPETFGGQDLSEPSPSSTTANVTQQKPNQEPNHVVDTASTNYGKLDNVTEPPTADPQSLTRPSKPSSSMTSPFQPESGYQSRFGNVSNHSPSLAHQYMDSSYVYDDYYTPIGSDVDANSDKLTNPPEFQPDDTNRNTDAPLSQIMDDSDAGSFTTDTMDNVNHLPSSSQISVQSYDVNSQPNLSNSQRFNNSPSNYEMNNLTPVSRMAYMSDVPRDMARLPVNQQQGMTRTSSKNILDSPNSGMNNFSFSMSRSMDGLNERPLDPNDSPYRTASFGHHQNSQETPYGSGHPSHDGLSMSQEQFNNPMFINSQVEPNTWNPRLYPMHQYQAQAQAQARLQNHYRPEFGMRPNFNRSSVGGGSYNEYEMRNPYSQHSSYQQRYMDKEKQRKRSMQEFDHDKMSRGQYPDIYWGNHQRQFYQGLDEDPNIDVTLSQPSHYMMYPQQHPYSRYYQSQGMGMGPGAGPAGMGMGMGMNRMSTGRLKNVPTGYSLSQVVEPTSRFTNDWGMSATKPRKSALKNSDKNKTRHDSGISKDTIGQYPIDEEVDITDDEKDDDMKPSPFRRSARKSLYMDDNSIWGNWEKKLETMNAEDFDKYYDNDDIPEQIGDSSSQRTNSPSDAKSKDEKLDMPSDLGHLHIVELLRENEPLGIQLVSYTSKGRDLGVFIGEMDRDGFAARVGDLQLFDRILACNGEDFTGESNQRVEERLREMISTEPLLKMAITRGLNFDLNSSPVEEEGDDDDGDNKDKSPDTDHVSSNQTLMNGETKKGIVSTAATNVMSTSVTNTRQLGLKKIIELTRGPKGTFGFGLSSRDVATNADDIPIYVKSISSDGPAFNDGRLKIGDRILEVNGVSVKGMSQSEVLGLLRSSTENLVLGISRQQVASEPQDEYSDLSQPTDHNELPTTIGKNVLDVNIPLNDCGIHGLGVTVYGRCSKKKGEDVGIYIKGIQPGGAAAKEGSLRVNDRLLSVNNQLLVNMSNGAALEVLKKGLHQANSADEPSIHLKIARTAGINRKQSLSMNSFLVSMPALQEEDKMDDLNTQPGEIGIDCPPELRTISQELDPDILYKDEYNFTSQTSNSSQNSYGRQPEIMGLSVGSYPDSQTPFSTNSKSDFEAASNRVKPSLLSNARRGDNSWDMPVKSSRHEPYDHPNDRSSMHSTMPRRSIPIDTSTVYSNTRHASVSPIDNNLKWYSESPSRGSSQSRGSSRSPSRPSSMYSDHSDRHMTSVNGHVTTYGQHARVGNGSFRRKVSPPYDTLEKSSPKERRNKPSHGSPHTFPKHGKKMSGRLSPSEDEVTSLYSYSSDTDLAAENPFQRTDKNRQSIPKNKKTPHNLRNMKINNEIPRLEGEGSPSPPLYRTGSDGDIGPTSIPYLPKEMFDNVEVGPNLRMAKSSSLESLQTVMHYTIRSDIGDRNDKRGNRSSFKRAVDRSYSGDPIPSSAVISVTKSPQKHKEPKKGILSRLISDKIRNKAKNKNKKNRRSRPNSNVDFETIEDIAKQYGISEKTILRMQSHSGRIEGDDDLTDDEDDLEDSQELHSLRNSRAL